MFGINNANANINTNQNDDTKMDYKIELVARLKYAYDSLISKKDVAMHNFKEVYDRRHRKVEFQVSEEVMLFWPVRKVGFT